MKRIGYICFFVFSALISNAQQIKDEVTTKVLGEAFIDKNDMFLTTNDDQIWAQYVTREEYYYMERKVAAPFPILAKDKSTGRNFAIKTKLQLGPGRNREQSIGVIFLFQPGGSGGYLLEISRKKEFRIIELKTKEIFTNSPEAEEGWLKSKNLNGSQEYNKVEIKKFRDKIDIYFNGVFEFGFQHDEYKQGQLGIYLGSRTSAKMDYFNVYDLDIPNAPKEENLDILHETIAQLQKENEELRNEIIEKKYANEDQTAVDAIKILEGQIQAIRTENEQLKLTMNELEKNTPDPSQIQQSQENTDLYVSKINKLTDQRDSLQNLLKTKDEEIKKLQLEVINKESSAITNMDLPKPQATLDPDKNEGEFIPDTNTQKEISINEAPVIEEKTIEEKPKEIVSEVKEIENEEKEEKRLVPLSEQNIPVIVSEQED